MLVLVVSFAALIPRAPVTPRATPRMSATTSAALYDLATVPDKTVDDQKQIISLCKQLEEQQGGEQYLDSPTFVGNYELLFYDGSDGRDQRAAVREAPRPTGLRRALRRLLFHQRGSFQHVVGPERLVNILSFSLLGLHGQFVAEGEFSRLGAEETAELAGLTSETVRVVFSPPRVAIAGCCFELKGAAAQPPVILCTTYLDDRVRLGKVSGGGRLVFGRGGKADEPLASEWQPVLQRSPTDGRLVMGSLMAVTGMAVLRPSLLGQCAYAAAGVGLGFGSTKLLRYASSQEAKARLTALASRLGRWLNVRSRIRAALLRLDPSLAETEGQSFAWADLRGPFARRRGERRKKR